MGKKSMRLQIPYVPNYRREFNMLNELITTFIVFLLNRFAFHFTEEQRDRIQEVLSENQPI